MGIAMRKGGQDLTYSSSFCLEDKKDQPVTVEESAPVLSKIDRIICLQESPECKSYSLPPNISLKVNLATKMNKDVNSNV